MAHPAVKLDQKYTYGDYYSWHDDERWELIEGVPYNMTPAPLRIHQEILGNLHAIIKNLLGDKSCKVYLAPFDVRLPEAEEADEEITTVVQPDLSIICDEKKLDDKGCRGAPDIVVEILSPFTAAKDRTKKFELYQKHKVKEYWVVYPNEKFIDRFVLGENEKYVTPIAFVEKDKLTTPILEGLEITIEEVFK